MDSSARRFGSRPSPYKIERPVVLDTRFFIPHKYFKLVWEVSEEWHKLSKSKSGRMSHQMVSLFNQAFQMGVGVTEQKGPDHECDIVAIWYKGWGPLRKEHTRFFQLIAKYVQEGSYINLMKTDRPDRTRQHVSSGKALEETFTFAQWYFNGDCMIEKSGKLEFTHV